MSIDNIIKNTSETIAEFNNIITVAKKYETIIFRILSILEINSFKTSEDFVFSNQQSSVTWKGLKLPTSILEYSLDNKKYIPFEQIILLTKLIPNIIERILQSNTKNKVEDFINKYSVEMADSFLSTNK